MNTFDELDPFVYPANRRRYWEGQVDYGRVTTVDPHNTWATVTHGDRKYQSGPLQILHGSSYGSQEYGMVTPGDTVWVLYPSRSRTRGLILGSVYTKTNPPPYNTKSIRGIVFPDGSYVIYDYASGGNYQINSKGKVTVTAASSVAVTATTTVTITSGGNTSINGVIIDPNGNVTLPAGKTLKTDFLQGASTTPIAIPRLTNQDGSGNGS